jgi:hypothetical protein
MYEVMVSFPWEANNEYTLTVRAEGFEVPTFGSKTYNREYHGNTQILPAPKQEGERKFSLTFRLDASYGLFGQFQSWLSSNIDPVTGGVSNWPAVLGKIRVVQLTGAFVATSLPNSIGKDKDGSIANAPTDATWQFTDVYVTKVNQPKFKTAGGDALTYTVDFVFADCPKYPFMAQKDLQ